jgi:hypothetical protein
MSTGGPFPGAKRGRGVTLTTHPHLVPRSRMSRNYISSPPQAPPWRVTGLLYLFTNNYTTECNRDRPSWEHGSRCVSQETPGTLENVKVYHHHHQSPPISGSYPKPDESIPHRHSESRWCLQAQDDVQSEILPLPGIQLISQAQRQIIMMRRPRETGGGVDGASPFCFWKFNQHQSRKKRQRRERRREELCGVYWYSVSINYSVYVYGSLL